MKIQDMQAIAEKRAEGEWTSEANKLIWQNNRVMPIHENDAAFIAMAANNWDAIMLVLRLAKESTYDLSKQVRDDLAWAIEDLEGNS